MSLIQNTININRWLCFGIGAYLNILLIHLVYKSKIKELNMFKNLIIQTCFINLYFLASIVVIKPVSILLKLIN